MSDTTRAATPGAEATDLFLTLTPERVLAAVEAGGMRCTGACYVLNSFENRVYEVELDDGPPGSRTRVVAKFYRPGRWSLDQLQEEHTFMHELEAAEIPICGLLEFPGGGTLRKVDHIHYCLYERKGGRAPDEVDASLAGRLGMLAARIHNVGATADAPHRKRLDADTFIRDPVDWLVEHGHPPAHARDRYMDAAFDLADILEARVAAIDELQLHRIHGDFHLGNLLLRDGLLLPLDFDDMTVAPAVQDLWLLLPGTDAFDLQLREHWITGYEQLRPFDRRQLSLIEPLRGARIVHYAYWLARRWHDPVFPRTWPHAMTDGWWEQETQDLVDLVAGLKGEAEADADADSASASADGAANPKEPELTNKDFFWDWEG